MTSDCHLNSNGYKIEQVKEHDVNCSLSQIRTEDFENRKHELFENHVVLVDDEFLLKSGVW